MKRGLLIILAGTISALSGTALTSQSLAAGCSSSFGNIKACSGDGNVGVSGANGANAGAPSQGASQAPAPVGATQLIACGTNTSGDLAGLGDPEAGGDAANCATAIPGCKATAPGATGASIRVQKQADGKWTLNGQVCTKPAAPVVTAAMVRDRVVRLIPTATLGLAPHDSTLVNIQTIMWVDAPKTQQLPPLTILGQHVTVSLTLARVRWDFGDQHTDTTDGPGKAYDKTHDPCRTQQCPNYFGHTYRTSGPQIIHATATWTATFTVNTGAPTTIPGTVDGPQATSNLTVKQARSVLVPNPGQH